MEQHQVTIREYDPAWVDSFERERKLILVELGRVSDGGYCVHVEHIGSTAVPGLPAKPCIDILLSVEPAPLVPGALSALARIGYDYRGENGISGREYLQRGPHEYHLHVVGPASRFRREHLLFRDYLRATPSAVSRYGALKRALTAGGRVDREHYQAGKADLIGQLLTEARRWRGDEE